MRWARRGPDETMDLQSVIAFQNSLSDPARLSSEDAPPANPTLRALDAVHKDYLKLHRRAMVGDAGGAQ